MWVFWDFYRSSGDNIILVGEGFSGSDDDDNDDRWFGVRVWFLVVVVGVVENSLFRLVGRGRFVFCDC